MMALQYAEYGPPEVLRVVDVEEPHAVAGQIRVAVKAVGVNPVDWKVRKGLMKAPCRPYRARTLLAWSTRSVRMSLASRPATRSSALRCPVGPPSTRSWALRRHTRGHVLCRGGRATGGGRDRGSGLRAVGALRRPDPAHQCRHRRC